MHLVFNLLIRRLISIAFISCNELILDMSCQLHYYLLIIFQWFWTPSKNTTLYYTTILLPITVGIHNIFYMKTIFYVKITACVTDTEPILFSMKVFLLWWYVLWYTNCIHKTVYGYSTCHIIFFPGYWSRSKMFQTTKSNKRKKALAFLC